MPVVNRGEALAAGARVLLLDGLIDACGAVARRIAAEEGAFDLSTMREPYRVEGKTTMGLELAEDLRWRLPDVIVYPTGGGTGMDGRRAGGGQRADRAGVQARGVRGGAVGGRGDARGRPGRAIRGGDRLVLEAVRASGGAAVAASEEALTEAQLLAALLLGSYVAPESGAALAAVRALRERGDLDGGEEVVVFDCGIGQKYPPPAGLAAAERVAG